MAKQLSDLDKKILDGSKMLSDIFKKDNIDHTDLDKIKTMISDLQYH